METLLLLESPVSPQDIEKIETSNIESDMIISPYDHNAFNRYCVGSYLLQSHIHNQKIFAIFDSNITIELTKIAEIQSISTVDSKKAIGLLAFLHLAEVDVEPGISMAEYSATNRAPDQSYKLHSLRKLDNLPADYLVDIALEREKTINLSKSLYKEERTECHSVKDTDEVRHWNMYYTFAMKIYLLANSSESKYQKVESFIKWTWEEFLFSAVAFTFAAIFFSGKYGKMIKNVNSVNKSKIWHGIKNATWDMVVISYWSDKVVKRIDDTPHYILCSADGAFKKVATMLLGQTGLMDKDKRFEDLFGQYLCKKEVKKLLELSNKLDLMLDDPIRKSVKVNFSHQYFSSCVDNLEIQINNSIAMKARQNA